MIGLSGKQKRFLRTLGQRLDVTCIVGKAGLTEGLIGNVSGKLARDELIKVRLPAAPRKERSATAEQLSETVSAELVELLGRTALLYRSNDQLETPSRIALP